MRILLAIGLLSLAAPALAQTYSPPPAKEGHSYPDCYCTNRGERVEMGGVVCMRVDGREFLARCEMSVNNPAWRQVQEGCPTAQNSAPQNPVPLIPGPQTSLHERLKRL